MPLRIWKKKIRLAQLNFSASLLPPSFYCFSRISLGFEVWRNLINDLLSDRCSSSCLFCLCNLSFKTREIILSTRIREINFRYQRKKICVAPQCSWNYCEPLRHSLSTKIQTLFLSSARIAKFFDIIYCSSHTLLELLGDV